MGVIKGVFRQAANIGKYSLRNYPKALTKMKWMGGLVDWWIGGLVDGWIGGLVGCGLVDW